MTVEKRIHLHRNVFITPILLALLCPTTLAAATVFAHQAPQPTNASANFDEFVGTWTAAHNGTQYFVLELRKEKGSLVGGIRVCGFSLRGGQGDITITNEKLSESLSIRNVAVSGSSLTFDWKDPDGDENHIQFERTAENSGHLHWRDLPADAKMPVISLAKQSASRSN